MIKITTAVLEQLKLDIIPLLLNINSILPNNTINEIEQSIIEKGKSNFVTKYDIKIEEFLKENLVQLLPCSSFYGEESGGNITNHYTWIVDPIDGTTNFIHGLPFSISIGLVKDSKTLLGIVYNPTTHDVYSAISGKGAYKNNNPIHVSNHDKIQNSVFAFGFPYDTTKTESILRKVWKVKQEGAADIKRIGPASLDVCRVAEGKLDGYFELDLQPWDLAASILILEEAGGSLVKMNGEKFNYTKSSILAINLSSNLQKSLIKILHEKAK